MSSHSAFVLGLLLLLLMLSNLPFASERMLFFIRFSDGKKPLVFVFVELFFCYFLVLLAGRFMESWLGQVHPQGWEFYVVVACLFLTFAFPGFSFRYLLRRSG